MLTASKKRMVRLSWIVIVIEGFYDKGSFGCTDERRTAHHGEGGEKDTRRGLGELHGVKIRTRCSRCVGGKKQ